MIYTNPIIKASFIKRPNRFVAHVMLQGKEEIVHVKNTGRCRELLVPGATVYLEDCRHNPGRKTRYSIITVEKGDMLVNMDSQAPNEAVAEGVLSGHIPFLHRVTNLRREVTFGGSRFDMMVEGLDQAGHVQQGYIEVKGVTLEQDGISAFPDAPTTRGARHVLELADAAAKGYQAAVIFLVQMRGPHLFVPHWERDSLFGRALVEAKRAGVKIWAYDSVVSLTSMEVGNALPVDLSLNLGLQPIPVTSLSDDYHR